jgi:hypothetical protein
VPTEGFAVPADFRSEILTKVFGEDSLIGSHRSPAVELEHAHAADGRDHALADLGRHPVLLDGGRRRRRRRARALGETTLKLHTLATLVPVTEELLEDAPAMGAYLNRKAPEKMDFKLSDAIVRGTGVGQPLGFLNSPALVTVSAEARRPPIPSTSPTSRRCGAACRCSLAAPRSG